MIIFIDYLNIQKGKAVSKELVETILKQAEILNADEKLFLANRLLEQVKKICIADSAVASAEDAT